MSDICRNILMLCLAASATLSGSWEALSDTVIITGKRLPGPVQDTVPQVEVKTRYDIKRAGDSTAADTLSRTSGVIVSPSYRGATFLMQGISSRHVLILVDGKRPPGKIGGTYDLESIPASQIERVEVIKGAQSVLYGSDAIGGVINIITKKNSEGAHGEAGIKTDSLNRQTVNAGAGSLWGEHSVEYRASWKRGDAYDLEPETPATTGSAYDKKQMDLEGLLQLSDTFCLEPLVGIVTDERRGISTNASGAVIDRSTRSETRRLRLDSGLDLAPETKLQAGAQVSKWQDQFREDQRQDDQLDRTQESEEDIREAHIIVSHDLHHNHGLIVGMDIMREILTSERLTEQQKQRIRKSPFVQYEWRSGEEDAVYLVPGLRRDLDSEFGDVLSKTLSLRYDYDPGLVIRSGYGEGFRSPSFKEQFLFFENPTAGYKVMGNPDLKPETSRSLSAGVSKSIGSSHWLSLGLFNNRINNLITTESQEAEGDASVYSYTNKDSVETRGFELRWNFRLFPWRLGLSYHFLQAKDLGEDRALSGRPKHSGTITSGYTLRKFGLRINSEIQLTGARPYYHPVEERVRLSRPHRHASVNIQKSLSPELELSLGVKNISNETDPGDNPVPPRSYFVGLDATI